MGGGGSAAKYVLVTGASKGIGRATALFLARTGFRVFAGVRREEDGESLLLEGAGRLAPVIFDVTDTRLIDGALGRIEDAAGGTGLWGLVNNAGIAVAAPVELLPLGELRRQLEVNVVGQVAVIRAFLPLIRRARGRIVNVTSIGGLVAGPMLGAYHASKFAMEAVTDSLRGELRPWGIEVCAVEPGEIATPIWETSRKAADTLLASLPPGAEARYHDRIERMKQLAARASRRGTDPEAVARVIARALTSPHPRTRYRVGKDARLASALRFFPARLRDRLIEYRG